MKTILQSVALGLCVALAGCSPPDTADVRYYRITLTSPEGTTAEQCIWAIQEPTAQPLWGGQTALRYQDSSYRSRSVVVPGGWLFSIKETTR